MWIGMPELPIHPAVESPEPTPQASLPPADPLSAMTPRFNFFFRWFARRFFSHFGLDEKSVAKLRELERRGSVVYVMRYASRLDYFLFNALFLREGLRLSRFANGIRFHFYRPLLELLAHLAGTAGRGRSRAGPQLRARARERRAIVLPVPAHRAAVFAAGVARAGRRAGQERARPARGGGARGLELGATDPAGAARDLLAQGTAQPAALPEPLLRRADAALRSREGGVLLHDLPGPRGQGRRIDRPARLHRRPPRRGRVRHRPHGASLDPDVPVSRREGRRGTDAAAARQDPADRAGRPGGRRGDRAPRRRARRAGRGRARGRPGDVPRDRGSHELDVPRDPQLLHLGDHPPAVRVGRGVGDREGGRLRQAPSAGAAAEPSLVFRFPDRLHPVLRELPDPAPHRGAREHGLRTVRVPVPARRRVLPAPLVRRRALQGGVSLLHRLSGEHRRHAGVLHRRRPLAHGQDAGAPARDALAGTSTPSWRARAGISSSCRSPSPTSGWWKRARWSTSSRAAASRTRACSAWCARGSICSDASAACS